MMVASADMIKTRHHIPLQYDNKLPRLLTPSSVFPFDAFYLLQEGEF